MIEYIPVYIFLFSQQQSALVYSTSPTVANLHLVIIIFLRVTVSVVLKLKLFLHPSCQGKLCSDE